MVELKPELSKYLMNENNSLQSLENTKYFAPYFHIKEMLKGSGLKTFVPMPGTTTSGLMRLQRH